MALRLVLAAFTLASTLLSADISTADDRQDVLRVFMNQARVLKLDRPVAKVIVGNSEVADATVADATTICLLYTSPSPRDS